VAALVFAAPLLMLAATLILARPGHAQEAQAAAPPPPDEQTLLTREQWLERIAAAKERLRLRRAQGLSLRPSTSDRDLEQENSERAMTDELLQRGDIISTTRGLLRFKGRAGEPHKPEDDFVPAQR